MAPIDLTSSSLFQPIARVVGGLSDAWRFLTRPVSADFHNDPEARSSDEESRHQDDRDKEGRFHEFFHWHHS